MHEDTNLKELPVNLKTIFSTATKWDRLQRVHTCNFCMGTLCSFALEMTKAVAFEIQPQATEFGRKIDHFDMTRAPSQVIS